MVGVRQEDIAFGLLARVPHHLVPGGAAAALAQGLAAARPDRALEDVAVVFALRAGRLEPLHAQHVAKLRQEHPVVGAFGAALAGGPSLDE